MVGDDDQQNVTMGARVVLGQLDGAVKFDGVEHPALGVHVVGVFVEGSSRHHQHKSPSFWRSNSSVQKDPAGDRSWWGQWHPERICQQRI